MVFAISPSEFELRARLHRCVERPGRLVRVSRIGEGVCLVRQISHPQCKDVPAAVCRRRNTDLWKAVLPVIRCGLSSGGINRQQRIKPSRLEAETERCNERCQTPRWLRSASETIRNIMPTDIPLGKRRNGLRQNHRRSHDVGGKMHICLCFVIQLLLTVYP